MIMKRIVLFLTALLLMLAYSEMYGQSSTKEETIDYPCGGHFGESVSVLNSNVACDPSWNDEKNAVVRVEMPLSIGECDYCTGTLVNTTDEGNNNRHFILLAGHCLTLLTHTYKVGDLLNDWKFYWHYESWDCTAWTEPPRIFTTGAKVVAKYYVNTTLDFALLELYDDPAEAWDVTPYYLGWDRGNTQTSGTIMHHPMGDIKKITPEISSFATTGRPDWAPEEFWRFGTTFQNLIEGGSSGSPMLNSSHKIIGVCNKRSNPIYQNGGYFYWVDFSKFGYAWNGITSNPDSTSRLKDWLDPLNKDYITLDGRGNCQKTIKLQYRQPRRTETYHAVENIISKATISKGFDVTYKAGTEIVLMSDVMLTKDGTGGEFHAASGSNFHAYIEELNCNTTPPTALAPKGGGDSNELMEVSNLSSAQPQPAHELNIVPNPNNGSFQMEANFPLSDIAHLKIVNLLGVPVLETQRVVSHTIQLENAVNGPYFVVMILKDGSVITRKMMVQ